MNDERQYELISRLVAMESEINNMKEWKQHQNERINKMNDQVDAKTQRLEEKIDKILSNERQLFETINDSGSTLDDKIDERFNKLQMWLLGTAATAGIGLLLFILENIVGK